MDGWLEWDEVYIKQLLYRGILPKKHPLLLDDVIALRVKRGDDVRRMDGMGWVLHHFYSGCLHLLWISESSLVNPYLWPEYLRSAHHRLLVSLRLLSGRYKNKFGDFLTSKYRNKTHKKLWYKNKYNLQSGLILISMPRRTKDKIITSRWKDQDAQGEGELS